VGHGDVFEHNAKAQLKKGITVLRCAITFLVRMQ